MKREIHYYCYPGCLGVSLVFTSEEGEEWQPMKIFEVARLWPPYIKSYGEWCYNSARLTQEERETIQRDAKEHLRNWVRWSQNPNHENISEELIEKWTKRDMACVENFDYQII